jgi:hypothetical protein
MQLQTRGRPRACCGCAQNLESKFWMTKSHPTWASPGPATATSTTVPRSRHATSEHEVALPSCTCIPARPAHLFGPPKTGPRLLLLNPIPFSLPPCTFPFPLPPPSRPLSIPNSPHELTPDRDTNRAWCTWSARARPSSSRESRGSSRTRQVRTSRATLQCHTSSVKS